VVIVVDVVVVEVVVVEIVVVVVDVVVIVGEMVEIDPGSASPMAAVVQPLEARTKRRAAIGKRVESTGATRVNVMWE
jgi:hypothetical protein